MNEEEPDTEKRRLAEALASEDALSTMVGHRIWVLVLGGSVKVSMRCHFVPRIGEWVRMQGAFFAVVGVIHKEDAHKLRPLSAFVLLRKLRDGELDVAFDGAHEAKQFLDAHSRDLSVETN